MEQTPASRFVEVLGRLGYKTQQQIADLLQIARPTAGTIVRMEREPSFADVAKLLAEHDNVNVEWIFTGKGQALTRNLAPVATTDAKPPADTEAEVVALPTVERKRTQPTMRASTILDDMTPDQRADYWRNRYESVSKELAALREAQDHAEAVQLVRQSGGQSFMVASAEAADAYPKPVMVATRNHDFQRYVHVAAPALKPVPMRRWGNE